MRLKTMKVFHVELWAFCFLRIISYVGWGRPRWASLEEMLGYLSPEKARKGGAMRITTKKNTVLGRQMELSERPVPISQFRHRLMYSRFCSAPGQLNLMWSSLLPEDSPNLLQTQNQIGSIFLKSPTYICIFPSLLPNCSPGCHHILPGLCHIILKGLMNSDYFLYHSPLKCVPSRLTPRMILECMERKSMLIFIAFKNINMSLDLIFYKHIRKIYLLLSGVHNNTGPLAWFLKLSHQAGTLQRDGYSTT